MTSNRRSATSSGACVAGSPPSIRTTNSSPPIRPMVSASRKAVEQSCRDGEQQLVTGGVAERVVHVLEVVQVDVHRRGGRSVSAIAGQELLDAVHDQRPVRQTREWVVQRLVAQLVGLLTHESKRPSPTGPEDEHEQAEQAR